MVTCQICNEQFKILSSHVSFKHNLSKEEYIANFPDSDWVCKEESKKISTRLSARHAKEKAEDYERYMETKRRVCTEMRNRKGDSWTHTKETKEKMKLSHTGKKRKPHAPETRKKLSESRRGKKINLDPVTKKRKSELQKEAWRKRKQDSESYKEYVSNLSERRKAYIKKNGNPAIQKTETSIEIACKEFLEQNNIQYDFQYTLEGKQFDFFLPEKNLLLEVDGEYWHTLEPSIRNDIEKHAIAQKYNIHILRVSSDNLDFSIILRSVQEQIKHTESILENRGISLNEL